MATSHIDDSVYEGLRVYGERDASARFYILVCQGRWGSGRNRLPTANSQGEPAVRRRVSQLNTTHMMAAFSRLRHARVPEQTRHEISAGQVLQPLREIMLVNMECAAAGRAIPLPKITLPEKEQAARCCNSAGRCPKNPPPRICHSQIPGPDLPCPLRSEWPT